MISEPHGVRINGVLNKIGINEHEKESCDQCNLVETFFFVDEDFNNANLFLENYFFSHQANLTNLFNYHLLIRAPPVT